MIKKYIHTLIVLMVLIGFSVQSEFAVVEKSKLDDFNDVNEIIDFIRYSDTLRSSLNTNFSDDIIGQVYNWRISKEKYTAINPNAINSMIGSNNVGNKLLVNELENEDSILYLGMSLDESSLWLDSIGKWHEKYFTPTDPDDFSIGYNEVFTEEFTIWTDENDEDKVCGILIKNDMPTKLGLKRGDLKDDMVELYGENYTLYERINGNEVYEYKFDKHYLFVDIYEGKVDNWRISTHSYVEE